MGKQASPARRPDPLDDRLAAMQEARAALRDDTRAAHEGAQELRAATREARELLGKLIEGEVTDRLGAEVAKGLESYQEVVDKAITDASDAVFRRFDRMVAALLGDDTDQPLEETLRRYRDRQQFLEAGLAKAGNAAAGVQAASPKGPAAWTP